MDDEERNFCCLSLLLLRVGNTNLRGYFKKEWDSTSGYTPWTDSTLNGADLVRLRNPRILPYEHTKVNSGNIVTWDLSLMVKVLLNTRPPFVTKASQRKALEYLRDTRNSLCHAATPKIKAVDFNSMWEKSCNALVMFGGQSRDFKNVKKDMNKPWKELNPILKKWAAGEEKILIGLQQIHDKLQELQEGQTLLHEDHDILKKEQTALLEGQGRLEERVKDIQAALDHGQGRVEEGQTRLHQRQGRIEEGQTTLHRGQERIEEAQTTLHRGQERMEEGQTTLHRGQERMEEGQTTLHRGQERIEEGQTTLHRGQERMEEAQTTLHRGQERMEEAQTTLHRGQERMEELLKGNQEGIQQLITTNQTNMKRDFDIQYEISQICCLHQKSLQQSSSEDSAGSELVKFLKEYYKEGERALILPFPWMEGDRYHIKNLCTSTKIVDQDGSNDDDVPLHDFFSHAQGKRVKRILIQGVPGIGKSTFCKKVAYDWSENKMPSAGSFPELGLVLVIKCRDMRTGDLWEAIENQNFPDELHGRKPDVCRYIQNNQDKVLVLVDGYDEIPACSDDQKIKQPLMDLISGKLLSQCRIIVTSRPEKASAIRKHFDKKMEIQGFGSWSDSCTFIKRFFSSSPEKADDAILSIQTITAVRDLIRSPLNAAFLCLVFEERNEDKEDVLQKLDLCSLYDEIVFCVTKRYSAVKQGKVVEDDSLMVHFHDHHVQLGKTAFDLIQHNKNYFEEEKLPADSKDVLKSLGFLTEQKSLSKIRPKSLFSFTHSSIKEYFAAMYVADSLRRGKIDVLMSVMEIQASPSASSVDNSHHVQNIYYSLQRFNLPRMSRPNTDCAISIINSLASKLRDQVQVFSCEVVQFDFVFCFICELLGSFSQDEVSHILDHVALPDLPLIFYAYNGELAIQGLSSLLAHSIDESSKIRVRALRFEGLQVVSAWLDTMEGLSRALEKHYFLETLSLSFFSSFEDMSVFFSHFGSKSLKNLSLSFTNQEDTSEEDLEFNPLGNILSNLSSLVHLNLRNSPISDSCSYSIAVCSTLKILELSNCSIQTGYFQTLMDVLASHCCLEELDLSGSILVGSGFYLRNLLLESKPLKSLKLSNCCLDFESINCIFDALAGHHSLVALHASGNKLDEELCSYLEKVLTDDEKLKVLSLSDCHLNSDCISHIFNALAVNHSLTEIDLSGSSIDDWLCPYVKKILVKNQTLQILKLSHCIMGSGFLTIILSALGGNHCSLKEIDLSEVQILVDSSSESLTLEQFLSEGSSSDTRLSQDFNVFIREVESIVRGNQHLKVMGLRRCCLCHNSVSLLLDALSENQALAQIDLTGNEITDANRQYVMHMKRAKPGLAILI